MRQHQALEKMPRLPHAVDASFLAGAAALFILPESPRWLVVNNRLDEALSVIRRVYMSAGLANGAFLPQQLCIAPFAVA